VSNPLTAIIDQMSIELGLTEAQRTQVAPLVKAAAMQLQAIKDSTSLGALDKAKALVAVSKGMDEKVIPMLDATQQTKFKEMQSQMRRDMVEAMGHAVLEKLEAETKEKL
jgi:hypothetical protein